MLTGSSSSSSNSVSVLARRSDRETCSLDVLSKMRAAIIMRVKRKREREREKNREREGM